MIDVAYRLDAWTLTQINKEMNDLIKASPKDTVLIKEIYYSKIIVSARKYVKIRKLTPMEASILDLANEWFRP